VFICGFPLFLFIELSTETSHDTGFPACGPNRRKTLAFIDLVKETGFQKQHPGVAPQMVCLADYKAQFQVVFPEVVKPVCQNIIQPV